MLGNAIALACYIFDTHQSILVYFVDSIMKYSVKIVIIFLLATFVKHQLVIKINADDASSGTARRTTDKPSNP